MTHVYLLWIASSAVTVDALPWHQEAPALRAAQEADSKQALLQLQALTGAAAALLRGRLHRAGGRYDAAATEFAAAAADQELAALVARDQGRLALAQRRYADAVALLSPLLVAPNASAIVAPLAEALLGADPKTLLEAAPALRVHAVNTHIRSALLGFEAAALRRLGRRREAKATALRRYVEEPLAADASEQPPDGTIVTAAMHLTRAEKLLNAHRSEAVLAELATIPEAELKRDTRCQQQILLGLAQRKLHHYAEAATALGNAASCRDADLARRAHYVQAKVTSIAAGLAAIPIIERFAKRYSDHSMVDDVLFWAGDLYQRREQYETANRFFHRAAELKDDHCAEARWRLAWSAYLESHPDEARGYLAEPEANCSTAAFDRARAFYWSGRIATGQGLAEAAREDFRRATTVEPLGYYAQLAWQRIQELDANATAPMVPQANGVPSLCEGALTQNAAYQQGVAYLVRGLNKDAQEVLLTVDANATADTSECATAGVWLALLLEEAGAKREASWRLRTGLATLLERPPAPEHVGIIRAAFPLAYREELALAERESGLQDFFLQALAREESAFDPVVVSWAGAHGLTQLMFDSAQRAARMLRPALRLSDARALGDPRINARLGGALLGALLKRFAHPGLALTAYNAGEDYARTLWQRHSDGDFDRMAEDIGIKETRGYVMRVLQTFGIYRWLYAQAPLELPAELTLPKKP